MRLRAATAALALLGAGVAAYLTWVHYHPGALVCLRGSSGCETVNGSRYAELGGVPVALLGLVAYLVLVAAALAPGVAAAAVGAAVALAGLVFALWLVYVQAALVDAWCVWCLTSDVLLAAVTVLSVVRLVTALSPPSS